MMKAHQAWAEMDSDTYKKEDNRVMLGGFSTMMSNVVGKAQGLKDFTYEAKESVWVASRISDANLNTLYNIVIMFIT